MCPPPFLRLTITERRLPGVVKLYSIEASGFWVLGVRVCPTFRENGLFKGKLCYYSVNERIRLQEQKLWGIFTGSRGPKNQFLTAVAEVAA